MQTIVFDFGNVLGLFDHRRTLDRVAPYTDMSPAEIFAAVYDSALELAYEAGQISSGAFLREVRALCRLRCADDLLAEAWSDIFEPNVEVCALAVSLKARYRLLLGSNTNDLHARQFRRQFADTLRHFDHLVLSHEIGVRKPLAAFFDHCRGLAGSAAGECLFIDDLPANVAGARACGWHAIHYQGIDDLRRRLGDMGLLEAGR